MSVVSNRTVTTRREEYVVPAPACWTDVFMAVRMALRDYNAHHQNPEGYEPSDDAIQVRPTDEEIVVYWETRA